MDLATINESFLKVKGNKIHLKKEKRYYYRTLKNKNGETTFTLDGGKYIYNKKTKMVELYSETLEEVSKPSEIIQSNFGINERFDFLGNFANMVIKDITPSLLVSGEGGLGKTHTINKKLKDAGLQEDVDFKVIKGYSTPKALYATLYENLDSLIVFDDCDSVLKDPISLNILKGALDSYDKRVISWLSRGFVDDGLPDSFEFTGRVIFISNLPLSRVDGAVRSRTISVDLSMTLQDKIDRMRAIIKDILPKYNLDIKIKVLDYLDENKENAKEFNMRTLEKTIKVLSYYIEQGYEGQGYEAIKYLLTNV